MRLQLITAVVLIFSSWSFLYSQEDSSGYRIKDVDAYFLMHYYSQDGTHSAVEGGQGSEELQDIQTKVILNLLVDSNKQFGLELGFNHYTSASTDRIDFQMSSASRKDNRVQLDAYYIHSYPKIDVQFYTGASIESDYISTMFGFGLSKLFNKGNSSFTFTNKNYFDNWVVIFPVELRNQYISGFENSSRNSINNSITFWQAISSRITLTASIDFVFQKGLLSTPFHRVYFENDSVGVERLPDSRWRLPITVEPKIYLSRYLQIHSMYRYYYDDFEISSHTFEISLPFNIVDQFYFTPSYRFYTQSASGYFRGYASHDIGSSFHTSDYDLSDFISHKLGASVSYLPVWRLFRKRDETFSMIRSLSLKYSYYSREDGLNYHVISSGVRLKL